MDNSDRWKIKVKSSMFFRTSRQIIPCLMIISAINVGCIGSNLDLVSIDNRLDENLFLVPGHLDAPLFCEAGSITPLMEYVFVSTSITLQFSDTKEGSVVLEKTFTDDELRDSWTGSEYIFVVDDDDLTESQ